MPQEPLPDQIRSRTTAAARREKLLLAVFAALIMALLSLYSGGFFLYSAAAALAALAAATGFTAINLQGIEVERLISRTTIELGESIHSRLTVRNDSIWPAFWLRWREHVGDGLDREGTGECMQTVNPKRREALEMTLHSKRRGLFRVGPAIVEASDPFGLSRRFLLDREVRFVTVLPRRVTLGRGWPLGHRPVHKTPRRWSLFEDPSRFIGTRQYRPGDSPRRIHWRATARSGQIHVKKFEPSVLEGILLAVEMSGAAYRTRRSVWSRTDEEPTHELAIMAAASMAEYVLSGDQSVGLISNGADAAEQFSEEWTGGTFRRAVDAIEAIDRRAPSHASRPFEVLPGKGAWQLERMLTALARLAPATGVTLPALLELELPRLPRSHVLMIITPGIDSSLGNLLHSIRLCGIEVAVVLIGDAADEGGQEAALPDGARIYHVAGVPDIEDLGVSRL